MRFSYGRLGLAIVGYGLLSQGYAAGLDRSGQDTSAFLQEGTYAEAVYTYIDADVSGYDNAKPSGASTADAYVQGRATGDIAQEYDFFRYGVKTDINDRFSIGVLYDEPFGAAVEYKDNSNFVATDKYTTFSALAAGTRLANAPANLVDTLARGLNSSDPNVVFLVKSQLWESEVDRPEQLRIADELMQKDPTLDKYDARAQAKNMILNPKAERFLAAYSAATAAGANAGEATRVNIRTNNITALLGVKLGEHRNIHIYGGPAAQRLTGEVHLRGTAYQAATGYNAKISPDQSYGWVAGVAYTKPEIALKAALTYRSEIEHESTISEVFPAFGAKGVTTRDFKVSLPESYNLDLQSGINPTTLVMAKVRYVPWGKFDIRPPTYGDAALRGTGTRLPIVSYEKDQWAVELGLGKKLSDKVSVSGNIGWDSGAGSPVSTLGPIKGYYSVGLGAKYSLTPELSLALGGKYLKFGDATAQLPTKLVAGKFSDNDGYIVGAKLAYQHK